MNRLDKPALTPHNPIKFGGENLKRIRTGIVKERKSKRNTARREQRRKVKRERKKR